MLLSKKKWGLKLLSSVINSNMEDVAKTLRKGADVDFTKWPGITLTPLMLASRMGHLEIVKLLVDAHADVNTQAATSVENPGPFHCLYYKPIKKRQIKKFSKKRTFRGFGSTALFFASEGGHAATAEFLLKNGANPNLAVEYIDWGTGHVRADVTPLWAALHAGNMATIHMLMKSGATVRGENLNKNLKKVLRNAVERLNNGSRIEDYII